MGNRRIGQLRRHSGDDAPGARGGSPADQGRNRSSDAILAALKEMRARAERGEPPLNAVDVILGDDMGERIKNMGRCAMEKRVGEHFILAEKP